MVAGGYARLLTLFGAGLADVIGGQTRGLLRFNTLSISDGFFNHRVLYIGIVVN